MLRFEYLEQSRQALLIWEPDPPRWINQICSICLNASNSAQRQGGDKLTVPWWSFLGLRAEIDDIISHHQLQIDKDFFVSNEILELLSQAKTRQAKFLDEPKAELRAEEIQSALAKRGFRRQLTEQQQEMLQSLLLDTVVQPFLSLEPARQPRLWLLLRLPLNLMTVF